MREVKQFTTQAILTASRGQLVVMLYDGFLRFSAQAADALERRDPAEAANPLSRAQSIITELRASLDMTQGEIASRLDAIYDYVTRKLTDARVKGDPDEVRAATEPMSGLREAWVAVANVSEPTPPGAAQRRIGVDLVG